MRGFLFGAGLAALAGLISACNTTEARLGGTAVGAGAGAAVGGPVGAVAGGVVGYMAGPRVAAETRRPVRRRR
jgi:osmotically inducible lipoprotein OsmB